jgi:Bacterial transcriptional activator domain
VLVSSGTGYVLHLVPGQPDAGAFEQHLARARQLRKSGDPVGAATAIDSALGLWRGSRSPESPGRSRRPSGRGWPRLRPAAAEEPAEERADVLLSIGRHEEIVPDLTAMVADHPLRERMRGLLMIALYRRGGRPRRCGCTREDPANDTNTHSGRRLTVEATMNLGTLTAPEEPIRALPGRCNGLLQ